jgi:hypothetical protein
MLGGGDGGGGLLSSLGSLFGGGEGGGLGNFLASLGTAGLGAYASSQNNQAQLEDTQAAREFSAAEAEKERAAAMQRLMLQLANKGGGGGGGGAAASANVRRQAIADAMQTKLQGVQNNQGALKLFLEGIQNPYMRILGQ